MASNIDATQPPANNPTTAAMRANMAAAKAEIETLQAISTLYGTTLVKTTDQIVTKGGVATKINFDAIANDFGGLTLWNIANPSRITIPAGFSAARFIGQIRLDDAFVNQSYTNHIYKNGTLTYDGVSLTNNTVPVAGPLVLPAQSPWLPVAAADYFELGIINTNATTDNWVLGTVRTWFAVELRK